MKIEVTFDKTTKREFRDQCIKRLQSFVSQIKGNKENPQPKRDSVVSTSEEGLGESYRCKLNPVLID
jgi:mRNA-degrading endonuclease RelE of RelBE toxin-antitoxin system